MNWSFLWGPLVGAMIGYITNGIAIKMLFRPLKPISIGKYTLPFTPGVIPKEKARIANRVGKVVSRELLNGEVLRQALLRDELFEQIGEKIDGYIEEYKDDDQTLDTVMSNLVGSEKSMFLRAELEDRMTSLIYHKIVDMELGKIMIDKLLFKLKEGKANHSLGAMSFLLNEKMLQGLGEKIEPMLSQIIIDETESIVRESVKQESNKLCESTLGEWIQKVEPYQEVIKRIVLKVYEGLINHGLNRALDKLNIAEIIEKRIMDFDTLEMERIILELMNKELNMIIWLGALLGAIMGCVTNFF